MKKSLALSSAKKFRQVAVAAAISSMVLAATALGAEDPEAGCVPLTSPIPIKGSGAMNDNYLYAGTFPSGVLGDSSEVTRIQQMFNFTTDSDENTVVGGIQINKGGDAKGSTLSTPGDKGYVTQYGQIQLNATAPDNGNLGAFTIKNGTIQLSANQVAQAKANFFQKTHTPFPPLVCGAAIDWTVDNGKLQHGKVILFLTPNKTAVEVDAANDRKEKAERFEMAELDGRDDPTAQSTGQVL